MAATPNYSGMFLRGYGSQSHTKNNGSTIGNTNTNHASGQIGVIQGDAIRQIWARFGHDTTNIIYSDNRYYGVIWTLTGALHYDVWDTVTHNMYKADGLVRAPYIRFDASYITPTANEIRPVNTAVRYLIRCR